MDFILFSLYMHKTRTCTWIPCIEVDIIVLITHSLRRNYYLRGQSNLVRKRTIFLMMKQDGQLIFSISSLYRLTSQSSTLSRRIGVNFLPYFQSSKSIPPFLVFTPFLFIRSRPLICKNLKNFHPVIYFVLSSNWKLSKCFCKENDLRRRQQQLQIPEMCNSSNLRR